MGNKLKTKNGNEIQQASVSKKISFVVKDTVFNSDLNPTNLTLPTLSEFVSQVGKFIRGSKGRQDLNQIKTSIENGSLRLVAQNDTNLLDEVLNDFRLLQKNKDIDTVDSLRANVIEGWQNQAKRNSDGRVYEIFVGDDRKSDAIVIISNETNYASKKEVWINVELYLYGKVYDLGGKNKSNVHLELENGSSIKIDARASFLAKDKENRLYKDQLVRIKAKKNIFTHKIKDEQLISFEHYNPEFNEDDFKKISKKARISWKSVESATEWVENLRGSDV